MDRIVPISDLQTKAKGIVEQVRKTNEPVIITQRGRAAAVLVNYETYEGHLITRDEMSYPDWERRLARAEVEIGGKGLDLERYAKKRAGRVRKRKAG